jgi:restriction endonuclease S subunit
MELIKSKCDKFLKDKYDVKSINSLNEDDVDDNDKNKLRQYNYIIKELKEIRKKSENKIVSLINSNTRFRNYAEENKLNESKCKDKESVSFLMMMDLLEEGGTAIGVLKEGLFFTDKYEQLRRHCAENFNIEKIISIDSKQFENTSTSTQIIKFSKNGRTKKIKFYKLIVEKDEETNVEEDENGEFKITTVKDRINNVYDKLVAEATFEELREKKFNFNYKIYSIQELKINNNYELIKLGDILTIKTNDTFNNSILYKYVEIGDIINNQISNYNENYIINLPVNAKVTVDIDDILIASVRPKKEKIIYISKKLSNYVFSSALLKLTFKKHTFYFYNILYILSDNLEEEICHGSTYPRFNYSDLENLRIPVPKDEKLINYWIDRINEPYNLLNQSKIELKELEQTIKDRIEQLLEENETEEVKLGDLCEFNYGTRITKNNNITGIYPVYGGGDITFYTNTFNRENKTLVLSRFGLSNNCIRIIYNRFFLNDNGMSITSDINNYLGYYLKINEHLIINTCSRGSIQNGIDMKLIRNFNVKLPVDRELINKLNPLFDRVDELNNIISENERLYQQYLDELRNDIFNNDNNDNEIKEDDEELYEEEYEGKTFLTDGKLYYKIKKDGSCGKLYYEKKKNKMIKVKKSKTKIDCVDI